ncbi:MAG: hypothetical protein CMJ19_04060 [Phycisphaeraceae bacterium]|nr:hypothetical protein [Phycisphaeraceae bacterium]
MAKAEAQQLLDELNRLEDLRNPARCEGKRQFQRFVVRADAELIRMDRSHTNESPIPIMLRDIGRGGIGFVCTDQLESDSLWQISFLQHGFVIGHMGLIVRHSRTISDDVYLIGGQFCSDSGLLYQLGVNPSMVAETTADAPAELLDETTFVDPGEM